MGLFGPSAEEIAEKVLMVLTPAIKVGLGFRKDIPANAADDDFLLAYIFGALLNGYIAARIKDPRKQQQGAYRLFSSLFGTRGPSLANRCYREIESTPSFKSTVQLGARETAEFIGGEGTMPMLTQHLGSYSTQQNSEQ